MDGSIAPRSGYDIIGDLHGYAARLESLLTAMSYVKRAILRIPRAPRRRGLTTDAPIGRNAEHGKRKRLLTGE